MKNSPLRFHRCFGDGMVLQRDVPVRVSGVAAPGAKIAGSFRGASASATAGDNGEWEISFPPGEAGGPFDLEVSDASGAGAALRDVLVGEVWLCSGQSNMEYPVFAGPQRAFWGLPDGQDVARDGDPLIRLFQTPRVFSPGAVCAEPPPGARWRSGADPTAVAEFSAVGWFFGRALRRALGPDVPVGLINSSWGGTLIEPWIARSSYEKAGFTI
ncbi:MAG: hypothetical protein IJP66_01110, partial [Kiritimatiellae bacterium]|nr:hypothetical protein [Kiritimatiellia bacterium]